MGQANDLLNSISEPAAGTSTEGNLVIGRDRHISVPESLKKIAVQYDHDVETVTFDCPRYWDSWDFATMKIYINYMRSDGAMGTFLCENVVIDNADNELIHFDWRISGNVTLVAGGISFLVCIKNTDVSGSEITHWNSELNTDMYVSAGMKCQETILRRYPDIITQLLVRMETSENRIAECINDVENKTSRESMLGYVETYLTETSPNWLEDFFITEQVMGLVRNYMDDNGVRPGTKIIIGSEKPNFECIWFNTSATVDEIDYIVTGYTMTDPNTGKKYELHINNGKLAMAEVGGE